MARNVTMDKSIITDETMTKKVKTKASAMNVYNI